MASPCSADASRADDRGKNVSLVLGPTNTGKTHFAIERMLSHKAGIIGLPLRLLAREVYNRVVEKAGSDAVALVTGEERIKPRQPRYWVCTVEAMPRDVEVPFLAIDEIQLAADLDRGHVFTDRLLNRRGVDETLLIGAQTMERVLSHLLPEADTLTRPRLSNLVFAGDKKIARLPPRSAIVAFSVEEVYAIAEWIRRQKGGAAVVMGALSPRTRNAQVDMYQSGEVDYIIATDAIGMGLNLDVDHVAFASDRKFDGWHYRRLHPAEFGQIAGRAGRHLSDGTFGTTGRCPPFDGDLVEMLETHQFDAVRTLQWRNTDLDMSSLDALSASLDLAPGRQNLSRAPLAQDQIALDIASRDADVRKVARNRGDITRLWECCQIPDYRKLSPAAHADLVLSIYRFIARAGHIPDDWFAQHLRTVDRVDGDIDALSARIAQVRTWTFIANRPDWLRDPEHWQAATRRVEDTLSDALHQRLTQRFVDRRTSFLRRRLRENSIMEAEITPNGDVMVEGQHIGQLNGFRFTSDPQAIGEEAKTLNAAAQKALATEIEGRAARVHEAVDEAFVLANDGLIRWLGEPVGRIVSGAHILEPQVRVISDEKLTGPTLELVQRRLDLWLGQHIKKLLGPLSDLEKGEGLEGIGRGIAFQVAEALGVLERSRVAEDVKSLSQDVRGQLRKFGVRFGAYHLYLPALVKPAPRALAAQLWALKNGGVEDMNGLDEVPHLAASGRTSFVADAGVPKGLYRAAGFRVCGDRAVRIDILERLADLIRPAVSYRPGQTPGDPPPGSADGDGFVVTVGMTSLAGCSGEAFGSILKSLGYVSEKRTGPAITVPLVAKAPIQPVQVPVSPSEVSGAPSSDTSDKADALTAPLESPEVKEPDSQDPPPAPDQPTDDEPSGDDLKSRLTLARQNELIAEALEGSPLEAIEPPVRPTEPAPAEPNQLRQDASETPEAVSDTAESVPEVVSASSTDAAPSAATIEGGQTENPQTESQQAESQTEIEIWRPHRQGASGRRASDRTKGRGSRRPHPTSAARPAEPPAERSVPTPNQDNHRATDDRPHDPRRADGGGKSGGRNGKFHRDPRRDDKGGKGRPHDDRRQGFASSEPPKPRDRRPDPDSPFAKLAALKAQMEKEQR